MNINRTVNRTMKTNYIAPHSEIITLNVSGDIMDDGYHVMGTSKGTLRSLMWAKHNNWEPVAPDLGDMDDDDNDWDGQTHAPKMKSVWDD